MWDEFNHQARQDTKKPRAFQALLEWLSPAKPLGVLGALASSTLLAFPSFGG